MFDIGWTELVVIAVVAIVVIGPKDLPRAMRAVGQFTGKMKRMAREFQGQFNEALREAELDDVKKSIQDIASIDPMADVKAETAKVDASIREALNKPAPDALMTPAADKPAVDPLPAPAPAATSAAMGEAKP